MLYAQGKTIGKMQHSEQSFSGLKYKQADRFNFSTIEIPCAVQINSSRAFGVSK
jgi:hypothetical protein